MTGSHDSGEVPAQSGPQKRPTKKVPRVEWPNPDRPPSFAGIDSDPTPTGPRSSPPPMRALAPQATPHFPLVPPPGISDEETLDEPPPPTLHPVTTPPASPHRALGNRVNTGEYRFISSKPPKRDKK